MYDECPDLIKLICILNRVNKNLYMSRVLERKPPLLAKSIILGSSTHIERSIRTSHLCSSSSDISRKLNNGHKSTPLKGCCLILSLSSILIPEGVESLSRECKENKTFFVFLIEKFIFRLWIFQSSSSHDLNFVCDGQAKLLKINTRNYTAQQHLIYNINTKQCSLSFYGFLFGWIQLHSRSSIHPFIQSDGTRFEYLIGSLVLCLVFYAAVLCRRNPIWRAGGKIQRKSIMFTSCNHFRMLVSGNFKTNEMR